MTTPPYVIVQPGGWGHVSDNPHAHLVVRVDEWVRVYHQEQERYHFVVEHGTYDAAHDQRNELNGTGHPITEPPEPEPAEADPEQAENPVEYPVEVTGEEGVKWLGAKVQ